MDEKKGCWWCEAGSAGSREQRRRVFPWCPPMSRLSMHPAPATVGRSECLKRVLAGQRGWWWHVAILLTSLSPDHLSVLTCERASRQLTGKRHFYKYGNFPFFRFPQMTSVRFDIRNMHHQSLSIKFRFSDFLNAQISHFTLSPIWWRVSVIWKEKPLMQTVLLSL